MLERVAARSGDGAMRHEQFDHWDEMVRRDQFIMCGLLLCGLIGLSVSLVLNLPFFFLLFLFSVGVIGGAAGIWAYSNEWTGAFVWSLLMSPIMVAWYFLRWLFYGEFMLPWWLFYSMPFVQFFIGVPLGAYWERLHDPAS